MRFDVLPISDLGPDLLARWRQLLSASDAFCSPFFAPEFSQIVGRCRDDLFVGVIEQAGSVTGILPFHRLPGGRGVPVGGPVCDYQGIIGTPPVAARVRAMLRGFGFAAYDFNHGLAEQALLNDNAFAFSVSPRADLRQGYDAWAEAVGQKGKALKTLARKERKVERELGPLRFVVHDDRPRAWDDFLVWKRAALGPDFLTAGWDERLVDALRMTRTGACQGRLSTLYAGDRMVAAHFGISSPQAWHWWFPSYAPDTGNLSVGLVLMRRCIEAAAEEGIAELDFGRGTERYKIEFSNAERALCEGSLERLEHPVGALRRLRKVAQRMATATLSERPADVFRRAGNRLLSAGRF